MRKISKLCWILSICILPMLFVSCGHQHKYLKDVNEPTCTEEGFTLYLCEECGEFYEDNKKAPLGHDLEHHEGKTATCEEAGYEAYDTCKRCSYTTYKSIPALDHAYGKATYSWNQDNTKVTGTLVCDRNQTHIISETADVTKSIEPAKCLETGLITYTAEFKNKAFTTQIKEEEIKAIGHDIKTESAKAPTCKEVGYEAYEYCSRCDYSTRKEIPALGHSYNSEEICTRCGDLAAWQYLTYEYDNEVGGYAVTGVAEERTTIHIPETYMDKPVKKIADYAFQDQFSIIELNIPESIISIGASAFKNCKGLRELVIPTSVKQRGDAILSGCSNLESLTTPHLPNPLSGSIGLWFSKNSFENSYKVYYGYVPQSLKTVTYIGRSLYNTFNGCTYIEKIVLKEVTNITRFTSSEGAFVGCENLKELWFDSNLKEFGAAGLSSCTNLDSIYYKGTVDDWAKIDFLGNALVNQPAQYAQNIYFVNEANEAKRVTEIHFTDPTIEEISTRQFKGFKDVKKIILSSNITIIKSYAFDHCVSLEELIIPSTVIKISAGAFIGCYNVKSIDIDMSGLSTQNTSLIKLLFGNEQYENSYKVGPTAEAGFAPLGLEKIIIHGNASLLKYEFKNMTSLKEIYAQDMTEIPSYCFQNCSNLITIVLKNVIRIRSYAFEDTYNLKQVFYEGTQESWSNVTIDLNNTKLTDSLVYFFREEEPIEAGNYWHYVDGVPTIW